MLKILLRILRNQIEDGKSQFEKTASEKGAGRRGTERVTRLRCGHQAADEAGRRCKIDRRYH